MLSRTNSSLFTILIQIQCFAHWPLHCIKYFVYLFCANRIAEEYLCFSNFDGTASWGISFLVVCLSCHCHLSTFIFQLSSNSTVASACIIVHWFSCALVFGSVVNSFGCILSYTLCGGDWTCGLFSLLAYVLQNSKRNFYYVHFCSPHICNITLSRDLWSLLCCCPLSPVDRFTNTLFFRHYAIIWGSVL